jgi:hypothetical protein
MGEQNEHCVVLDDGWVLCSDGTLRENSASNFGTVRKPQSEYERCALVVQYWQRKLDLAIEEFDDKRAMLLADARQRLSREGNPGGSPMDTTEAVSLLNNLKAKVNHAKEMLAEAEQNLERSTPTNMKKSQDIAEQNRQRLGDFVQSISAIEI